MRPVITEKSMEATTQTRYTFKVNRSLRKNQIRKIVEEKYKVNVVAVRTMNIKKKGQWKKAMVELKKGQKIEGFGGESEKKKNR
jgi:large subunit ribosomal protein L23